MDDFNYIDFELLIQRSNTGFRAQVLEAPAGQASTVFEKPFTDDQLKNFFLEVKNFLLRTARSQQRGSVRRLDAPEIARAKAFGSELFRTVFKDGVKDSLVSSISMAAQQSAKLRIRLHLTDVPELANLPWEFLYNPSQNNFFVLSQDTPLVRQLDQLTSIRRLAVKPPLNILVMISSPSNYPKLDVQGEWAKLNESLKSLIDSGLISLEKLEDATLAALTRRLRKNRDKYHVFHFIGHGGFEKENGGVLVLEDEQNNSRLVSGQDLGTILYDHRSLRLVVLNSCEGAYADHNDAFSGAAQSLIQKQIPAVVAMQFEITDEAAKLFAYDFYGAVAEGYPLEAALAEARKIIYAEGNAFEWGTPVLYLRAPDGRIFDIDRPSPNSHSPLKTKGPESVAGTKGTDEPAKATDVAALHDDRGPMDSNSPFYVLRSVEQDALDEIKRRGTVILIKGSGQMGKSTLIRRILETAKVENKLVTYIDFQRFGKVVLNNAEQFFRQFCVQLSYQLGATDRLSEYDQLPFSNTDRVTNYVSNTLLKRSAKPIVIALDEVDCFFDADFRSDFFAMLRSWYNEGAFFPVWKQLDIVIATSVEPFLLIDDQGSPFNIGLKVDLTPFTPEEVMELNVRYGSPLSSEEQKQLRSLVGGHPFLVRRALYLIAKKTLTIHQFFDTATDDRGPFGDHLGYLNNRLHDKEGLLKGMVEILTTSTCKDERAVLSLEGLGLVLRDKRIVVPACQLYGRYFKERLHV